MSVPAPADGAATGMRLHQAQDFTASGHLTGALRTCDHDVPVAAIRMRLVGWLDQKGRVWTACPPGAGFDGGSLTPLLIQVGCD